MKEFQCKYDLTAHTLLALVFMIGLFFDYLEKSIASVGLVTVVLYFLQAAEFLSLCEVKDKKADQKKIFCNVLSLISQGCLIVFVLCGILK